VVYNFQQAFSTKPAVAVLAQAGRKGDNGSWAVSVTMLSVDSMKVAVDKDQIGDQERQHTTEEVDYIVFSAAGLVKVTLSFSRRRLLLQSRRDESSEEESSSSSSRLFCLLFFRLLESFFLTSRFPFSLFSFRSWCCVGQHRRD
jgi:hypothetical protein